MRKQSGLLNHVTDVAAERDGVPVERGAALDEHLAVGWLGEAVDELERRGFSRAAAAEKNQGLAAPHREAHVLQQDLTGGQTVTGVAKFDNGFGAGARVDAHGEGSIPRYRRMSLRTRDSIACVSLPVNVFCWLGW